MFRDALIVLFGLVLWEPTRNFNLAPAVAYPQPLCATRKLLEMYRTDFISYGP